MLAFNAKKEILPSVRGKFSLRGGELSNLLEEKIRELDSLDQFETGIRDVARRSTASILEELVSALTAGEPVVQSIHHTAESEIRANPFNAAFIVSDNNHPSPTSIFDAAFSSESCSVGSINGSFDMKESKTLKDPSHKCNKKDSLELESDLLDSANSVEFSGSDNEKIMNSVQSDIYVGVLGTKFGFSNQAVSKTKFLLKSILFFDSESKLQPSVDFFLYDIFASISDAFFMRMKSRLSLSEPNGYNHINDFLFEFLIESLVLRFNQFCMSGYKFSLKLPVLLNKEQLLKEINGEIERLVELSGKVLDDLAEQELSSSNMRWTTFDAEASSTAIDIETVILRELVDEMFMDLLVIN
ncbi:uncharacterized protein LOC110026232 [Phalaenopsis equestris]|uniref:uncharacterized protein LOC110026232 n=1 Tax=Phalaenopsis equestris TaxID=78828 RepID=UPI0009E2BF19|nr:uncharacterized protein LOC110026232 [Phalaenopsis equestris]